MRGILPDAVLCFMHPVKTPAAIREAYFEHGVRTFSLDTYEELEKIISACTDAATGEAPRDLRLCVRLRVSSEYSELSLASKFGCDLIEAPQLLQQARQHCDWLGVCFHVGSQAMTPFAFVQALDRTRAAIAEASVVVDMIDVGGGFPSAIRGSSRRRWKITSRSSPGTSRPCLWPTTPSCGASPAARCRPSIPR